MRATWKLLFLSILLTALVLDPCRCEEQVELTDEELLEEHEEEEFHDEQDFDLEEDEEQFELEADEEQSEEEEDEQFELEEDEEHFELDEDEWEHQDEQSPTIQLARVDIEQALPEKEEQSPPVPVQLAKVET